MRAKPLLHLAGIGLLAGCVTAALVFHKATTWRNQVARERQLVENGAQIRAALMRYHQVNNGRLPQDLSALTVANGGPLAAIPPDPMHADGRWALLREPGGGIVGVHSMSATLPSGHVWPPGQTAGALPSRHSEWRFAFEPGAFAVQVRGASRAVESVRVTPPPGPQPVQEKFKPVAIAPIAKLHSPPAAPLHEGPRRSAQICAMLQRSDENVCRSVETRSGVHAATNCRVSAQQRATACSTQAGTTALPTLLVPSPSDDI